MDGSEKTEDRRRQGCKNQVANAGILSLNGEADSGGRVLQAGASRKQNPMPPQSAWLTHPMGSVITRLESQGVTNSNRLPGPSQI